MFGDDLKLLLNGLVQHFNLLFQHPHCQVLHNVKSGPGEGLQGFIAVIVHVDLPANPAEAELKSINLKLIIRGRCSK